MSEDCLDTDFDRSGSDGASWAAEEDVAVVRDRVSVTAEPTLTGSRHDARFPDLDWIGTVNMGGGALPVDLEWKSNPRSDRLPRRGRSGLA